MKSFRGMLWSVLLAVVLWPEVAQSQSDSPGNIQERLAVYLQQRQRLPSSAAIFGLGYSPFGDLSVVGSNGFYYRATFSVHRAAAPTVIPVPATKLEAYNLDPDSKDPFDTLPFTGYPLELAIGRDNRLYLVVSELPQFPLTAGNLAPGRPLLQPKTKLYIIPTPFPPRILGTSLESIATSPSQEGASTEPAAALTSVVVVDLEGLLNSLKVRAVVDQEYLYVVTTHYPSPLSLNPQAPALAAPIRIVSKLTIFNADGKKIKEANLD